jgi:hypothetical protein
VVLVSRMRTMGADLYCVYNKTRSAFLSEGVNAIDTTTEPF